jgi:hypothetical protein
LDSGSFWKRICNGALGRCLGGGLGCCLDCVGTELIRYAFSDSPFWGNNIMHFTAALNREPLFFMQITVDIRENF